MGVSKKRGGPPPPNHPFVHRVFHEIFTIHFGGLFHLFLVQHPSALSQKASIFNIDLAPRLSNSGKWNMAKTYQKASRIFYIAATLFFNWMKQRFFCKIWLENTISGWTSPFRVGHHHFWLDITKHPSIHLNKMVVNRVPFPPRSPPGIFIRKKTFQTWSSVQTPRWGAPLKGVVETT